MYRLFNYRGSLSQICSFIILLVTLVLFFTSFNKDSLGVECLLLTFVLFLFSHNWRDVVVIMPFMLAIIGVLVLLILSGKVSERGFNAPINHALKFVSLAYTVSLSNVMQRLPEKNKYTLLKCVFIIMAISSGISVYDALFIDKYAIRYYLDRKFNYVVNFDQFYAYCIVLSVLGFAILSFYKKYKAVGQIILFLLLLLLVGVSLYTTGIMLCAIGLFLGYVIFKWSKSKTKFIVLSIIALLSLLIIFIFRNSVSDFIYNVTDSLNWIIRDRLRGVADMLLGTYHHNEYSYDRREELMGYSMSTFRVHPFLGVGYKGYGYGIIGCHQEWPDLLGVFGIVGLVIFVALITIFIKHVKKSIVNRVDLQSFRIALVLFVLLGFLNPCISMPTLCAVFIIAPNVSVIFPWWKKTKQKTINMY